ncbi:MAG: methyltransferase [Candidatus Latescibacteria bacterium]|nr:methyltransferase [Candidatus Latescibacterota bacterium]
MNPRDHVKNTLEFSKPERIPRQMWLLPYATNTYPDDVARIHLDFPDDIVHAPAEYTNPPKTKGDPCSIGTYIDEWGCIFENRQNGIIGEVKEPLLKRWGDVDIVRPPREMLSFDRDTVNRFCKSSDKFVLAGCCPRPFERLQFIRSTVNAFYDLIDRPEEFNVLLNRIHSFYLEEFEIWATTYVDGLMFMDDWGAQQSLLVSPDIWRELFKPLYRDYINLAHDHGKYCFMHSDGYIIDILPDLIDLGLDAINSQIFCMGVGKLGERFRGKITFWGEIDRQHILPYATVPEVVESVHAVRDALYKDGGVIAQCEFGPGAKPENVYAVFDTWNKI